MYEVNEVVECCVFCFMERREKLPLGASNLKDGVPGLRVALDPRPGFGNLCPECGHLMEREFHDRA